MYPFKNNIFVHADKGSRTTRKGFPNKNIIFISRFSNRLFLTKILFLFEENLCPNLSRSPVGTGTVFLRKTFLFILFHRFFFFLKKGRKRQGQIRKPLLLLFYVFKQKNINPTIISDLVSLPCLFLPFSALFF